MTSLMCFPSEKNNIRGTSEAMETQPYTVAPHTPLHTLDDPVEGGQIASVNSSNYRRSQFAQEPSMNLFKQSKLTFEPGGSNRSFLSTEISDQYLLIKILLLVSLLSGGHPTLVAFYLHQDKPPLLEDSSHRSTGCRPP